MITALYALPGERATKIDALDIARVLSEGKGILWVDLDKPTEEEVKVLSSVFHFHPLAIEDCVAAAQHPKVDDYSDYLYLVMHGAEATAKRGSFQTQELDLFLGKSYLVTHRSDAIRGIETVRKRAQEVAGFMARGSDFLLYAVLAELVDSFVTTLETMETEVDVIEHKLFKDPGTRALAEIFAIKKDILHLRRVVLPQREVLTRLSRAEFRVVTKEIQFYFRDVYDHAFRVADLTESLRDLVTSALETYLAAASNRTGEVMKVLTVWSIVLMTLSLVAGIYGMNIWLPLGHEQTGWRGSFFVILGAMAALVGVAYFFFRKRKWV